jgi:hypothetical protein
MMATTAKLGAMQPCDAPVECAPEFAVRHYSPAELAELWGLSVDTIRKLFDREPGVMVIRNPSPRPGKRSYTTMRIPADVVERVHRRLTGV